MKAELHTFLGRLLESLLNGTYQGILVALLVALLLRFCVRANAATRHAVWLATLLLITLLIPAHYYLHGPRSQRSDAKAFDLAGNARHKSSNTEPQSPLAGTVVPWQFVDPELPGDPFSNPVQSELVPSFGNGLAAGRQTSEPALQTELHEISNPVSSETGSPRWRRSLANATRWAREELLRPLAWNIESDLGLPLMATFAVLWLVIAGGRVGVLGWRLRRLRELLEDTRLPDPALGSLFDKLRREGKIRRTVSLRISGQQRCPLLLGFLRPTVLLPAEMAVPLHLGEVEHVLRHELAHVRRYDDCANLLQHFIQAILFFHPAVLWIGKRLCLEREIACDDHVLQQVGGRRDYALLLANIAGRIQQRTPVLAPGVSNSHSQLQQRISMILNTRRNSSPTLATTRLASIVSLAGIVAVVAMYSGPRLVLGGPSAAPAVAISSDSAAVIAPAAQILADSGAVLATPSIAGVALAEGPQLAAAGIDPGPKFKPEAPAAEPPAPGEVESPEPPETPSVDQAPDPATAPRIARAPKPGKSPRPSESADTDTSDSSIEERLRRLEKMVRSLMDQQGRNHPRGAFMFKDGADVNVNVDEQRADKLKRMGDLNRLQDEKLQQLSERQSARAAEQVQRALEQVQRASKDLTARLDKEPQAQGEVREALQRQLEALRQAREGLGREIEKLDHQIKDLEKEQKRSDKESSRRRSEVTGPRLQADLAPAPDAAP